MLRTAIFLIAWFAFLLAAIALAVRFVPVVNHAVLAIAALSPYLAACAGIVVLPTLITPWRLVAVPALLLVAVTAVLHAPLLISEPATQPVPIRLITANLMEGAADPHALAASVRDGADLLAVQELTTELADELDERVAADFPFRALNPGRGATGTGIWSRYPIVSSRTLPGYRLGITSATVRIPGVSADTVVLCAHLVGPWPYPIDGWREELARLPQSLDQAARAAASGAVIVAGDFNATRDMAPYRRLLRGGYRDAADQSGAGLVPTFPADRPIPPILSIDHILTRNSSASGVHTVRIPGTDHLGLAATIHLR